MTDAWPWLALAGMGALHGASPTGGWPWLAAWSARTRDKTLLLRGLVPLALGHASAVALAAGLVAAGLTAHRGLVLSVSSALFLVSLGLHLAGHGRAALHAPAGHAALACWSFGMASLQGAGLALVPALLPLCAGAADIRDSDGLALALAGVGVHLLAMLATTGAIACVVSLGRWGSATIDSDARPLEPRS